MKKKPLMYILITVGALVVIGAAVALAVWFWVVKKTCAQEYADCENSADCCTGLECINNKCSKCVPGGQDCRADPGNCCSGLKCIDGKCGTCHPEHSSCTDTKQCCESLICTEANTCERCKSQDETCSVTEPCCPGLSCSKEGKCEKGCKTTGESCDTTTEFCCPDLMCNPDTNKCYKCGNPGEGCSASNPCCKNFKCDLKSGTEGTCLDCVGDRQPCGPTDRCCDNGLCINKMCIAATKHPSANAFFLNYEGKCLSASELGQLVWSANPCVWKDWDQGLKAFWFWNAAGLDLGVEVKGTPSVGYFIASPKSADDPLVLLKKGQLPPNPNVILNSNGWITTSDYSLGVVVVSTPDSNYQAVWKKISANQPTAFNVVPPDDPGCAPVGGDCSEDSNCCVPYKACGPEKKCVACFSADRPTNCFTPQVPACVPNTDTSGFRWECVEPSTICPDAPEKPCKYPNLVECNVETRKWECVPPADPSTKCPKKPSPPEFRCQEGKGYRARCDMGTGFKWICQSYCDPAAEPQCPAGQVSLCYPDAVTGVNKWHPCRPKQADPCADVPAPRECASDYNQWTDQSGNCIRKCWFDMDKADLLEWWRSGKPIPVDAQTATVLGGSGETVTVYFDGSEDVVPYGPTRNCSRKSGKIQAPLDEWEEYLLQNPNGNVTKQPDGSFVVEKCTPDEQNPQFCQGTWYYPKDQPHIMCPFTVDPGFCQNKGHQVLDPSRQKAAVTCDCDHATSYKSKFDGVDKHYIGSNCQYSDNTTCKGLGAVDTAGTCSGVLERTTYWTFGPDVVYRLAAVSGNVDTAPIIQGTRASSQPWSPVGKLRVDPKTTAGTWVNPTWDLCNAQYASIKSPNNYIHLLDPLFLTLTRVTPNPDPKTIFCQLTVRHGTSTTSLLTIYVDPTKAATWTNVHLNTTAANNQALGDATLMTAKAPFVWSFLSGQAILTLSWELTSWIDLSWGGVTGDRRDLHANGTTAPNGNVIGWDKAGNNYYLTKGNYVAYLMTYNSVSNNHVWINLNPPQGRAQRFALNWGQKQPNDFWSCCLAYKGRIATTGVLRFAVGEDNTAVYLTTDINVHLTEIHLTVVPLDPVGVQGVGKIALTTPTMYSETVPWSNPSIQWTYAENTMNGNSIVFLSLGGSLQGFSDLMEHRVALGQDASGPNNVITAIGMAGNGVDGVLATRTAVFRSSDAGKTWDEWKFTKAMSIANVVAIAISDDGQKQILGTATRGIWTSTDGGHAYTQTAIDDPNVLNVSMTTAGTVQAVFTKTGVFFGNGQVFKKYSSRAGTSIVTGTISRASNAETSFIVTQTQIFRGSFSGQWVLVHDNLPNMATAHIDCSTGASTVAVISNGANGANSNLNVSNDFGTTWRPALTLEHFRPSGIVVSPQGRTIIANGVYQPDLPSSVIQVAISTDYGHTFTKLSVGKPKSQGGAVNTALTMLK